MSAYYNEFDPYAAAWLRNLIIRGLIAPGDVDERSIEDICPDDLRGYTQCHFFAGIGVWSRALRQAGWSDDQHVWTGSPPCQPFSEAGSGEGFDDERHLWPAFFHLIEQCRPSVIFGEQVEAAVRYSWLDLVQTDMENLGYSFGATALPACGFGAPHIRQRIFFVGTKELANPHGGGLEQGSSPRLRADTEHDIESCSDSGGDVADTAGIRLDERRETPCAAPEEGLQPRPELAGELSRGVEGLGGDVDGVVGNAECAGLEGHPRSDDSCDRPGRIETGEAGSTSAPSCTNGFWADADWLPFRDSKVRPVEPGISPLVNGASTRMGSGGTVETENIAGMLKGYGNAICAPVATEFVKTYLSIRP